jgi:hypothetical protein
MQRGVKSSNCILQQGDVTPCCILYVVGSQILPLHDGTGSQILPLHDAVTLITDTTVLNTSIAIFAAIPKPTIYTASAYPITLAAFTALGGCSMPSDVPPAATLQHWPPMPHLLLCCWCLAGCRIHCHQNRPHLSATTSEGPWN